MNNEDKPHVQVDGDALMLMAMGHLLDAIDRNYMDIRDDEDPEVVRHLMMGFCILSMNLVKLLSMSWKKSPEDVVKILAANIRPK